MGRQPARDRVLVLTGASVLGWISFGVILLLTGERVASVACLVPLILSISVVYAARRKRRMK